MKADWNKLGDKYANSDSVMIVDVDCTGPGQSTCGSQGVKGYPTIKYFMAGKKAGRDYQGGRDYKSLATFVKSTLDKAKCDALTGKNCAKNQKKFIEAHKTKSVSELEEIIATRKEKFTAAKAEQEERQKAFKKLEKEYKLNTKDFKKTEKMYNMASSILKTLQKAANLAPHEDL